MQLQHQGKLDLMPLITHEIPFERAEDAYRLLDDHPEEATQVVLSFDASPLDQPSQAQSAKTAPLVSA